MYNAGAPALPRLSYCYKHSCDRKISAYFRSLV